MNDLIKDLMDDEICFSNVPLGIEESRQQIKVAIAGCNQYLVHGPLARGMRAIESPVPCTKYSVVIK